MLDIMFKKTRKNKKNSSAKNNHKEEIEEKTWLNGLKEETRHSIFAVAFIVLGLIFTLSYFNKAGIVGSYLHKIFNALFGNGSFLVPLVLFLSGVSLLYSIKPNFLSRTIIGAALFLVSSLGAMVIIWGKEAGGYVGHIAAFPLMRLFDFWVSVIILCAVFIISVLIILNTSISLKAGKGKNGGEKETENTGATIPSNAGTQANEDQTTIEGEKTGIKEKFTDKVINALSKIKNKDEKPGQEKEESDITIETKPPKIKTNFVPPPLEMLCDDKGRPSSGDIKANANIIKRTLQNFGINVEMGEINIGPSVTQYTLKPAEGVKLSRIVSLQNDLALALAAHPLRIEAPVPGKSLVGIEMPNSTKTIVGLAGLFNEEVYKKQTIPLLVALGKDVTGKATFANMAKMPHLLVAGATGSGKSIYIHSLIISLLYRNPPEDVRFIMIDPKRVELTVYNKIPHILTPVITDTKKAIMTLKWLSKEMERRYDALLENGVRDIGSYHEKKGDRALMPYLVVIIDELADIMATYPREMESAIVRLAQMSRAVGIHLVLSTQRPSVEVITGLIKANITSRIAFQVASQIDSRTILDMSGAEKLLGNGDMLYLAGDTAKPRRIQGPFISEQEVKKVVNYLSEQYRDIDFEEIDPASPPPWQTDGVDGATKTQIPLEINFDEVSGEGDDDELYEAARETVIQTGKASTSYLQRKLKIGYARAARIIDMLEERSVVGPQDGAKARQVLIKANDNGPLAPMESDEPKSPSTAP